MNYEKPAVTDFGDLVELTESSGVAGASDGIGFTLRLSVGDTNASIGILP